MTSESLIYTIGVVSTDQERLSTQAEAFREVGINPLNFFLENASTPEDVLDQVMAQKDKLNIVVTEAPSIPLGFPGRPTTWLAVEMMNQGLNVIISGPATQYEEIVKKEQLPLIENSNPTDLARYILQILTAPPKVWEYEAADDETETESDKIKRLRRNVEGIFGNDNQIKENLLGIGDGINLTSAKPYLYVMLYEEMSAEIEPLYPDELEGIEIRYLVGRGVEALAKANKKNLL